MKSLVKFTLLAAVLALGSFAARAANDNPKTPAKTSTDYPLTTCVVSGDKLDGDMGAPFDYIYKQDGKPDRLVRFCCKNCVKDFQKDPAKYLKMIDDAAAAKRKAAETARQH
jgi:hypothetical protein